MNKSGENTNYIELKTTFKQQFTILHDDEVTVGGASEEEMIKDLKILLVETKDTLTKMIDKMQLSIYINY